MQAADPVEGKAKSLPEAHAAIAATEFARANIEHYLSLHGPESIAAHLVMQLVNDTNTNITKIVNDSAALAAQKLKAFADSAKED